MDKVAILLLSHLPIDYIDFCCSQFNNDERFNIYIHRDTKFGLSEDEEKQLLNKYNNLKMIVSEIEVSPLRMSMVDAEEVLLRYSSKQEENKYFVLFSEKTFLVKSLDEIYDTLINGDADAYIEILNYSTHENYKEAFKDVNSDKYFNHYGSQWVIFNDKMVNTILEKISDNDYKRNLIERQGYHCSDESFFQNMIHYDSDFKKFNIRGGMTFVCWDWRLSNRNNIHLPANLDIGFIDEYVKLGINNYMFARKCDYSVDSERSVIDYFKK